MAFDTITELRAFERGIVDLVEQSNLQRADYLVMEAIRQHGSDTLRQAAEIPPDAVQIDGWDQLCADLVEADLHFRKQSDETVALVQLALVNRLESGRSVEELRIERSFYSRSDHDAAGRLTAGSGTGHFYPNSETKALVHVTGLEGLMAVQRRHLQPGGPNDPPGLQGDIDHILSGLLLIVRYQQAVDRHLREQGLPRPVPLIVKMDHVSWPMEAGVHDFGPQAVRQIEASEELSRSFDAAAEILAERKEERQANFQAEVNNMIAENRELYRLIRMFPFYRYRARNQLAEIFDHHLHFACKARNLSDKSVGWRMSKRDFENFLTTFANSMKPPSIEDALDTCHVDELHESWLETALEKDFNLGSAALSMFEVQLAWALKFGGPIVQDRWEHAKAYRRDR